MGDLIYAYSLDKPQIHCLYWGIDWTAEQKEWWINPDKLHLSEKGYKELGRQVGGGLAGAGATGGGVRCGCRVAGGVSGLALCSPPCTSMPQTAPQPTIPQHTTRQNRLIPLPHPNPSIIKVYAVIRSVMGREPCITCTKYEGTEPEGPPRARPPPPPKKAEHPGGGGFFGMIFGRR